jgi:hypothetical protein
MNALDPQIQPRTGADLCVVVPYRDRQAHLAQFVPHIRRSLPKADILIVEQSSAGLFNRAKLLNVGFSFTGGRYLNYCFHDVDMLPITVDYSLCERPTHLAAEVEQFGWALPYEEYFGGVTLFDVESFRSIDGYANDYWGWGQEDDDLRRRCVHRGIEIARRPGRFLSLAHPEAFNAHDHARNQQTFRDGGSPGGLSTLEYQLLDVTTASDHSRILVEL